MNPQKNRRRYCFYCCNSFLPTRQFAAADRRHLGHVGRHRDDRSQRPRHAPAGRPDARGRRRRLRGGRRGQQRRGQRRGRRWGARRAAGGASRLSAPRLVDHRQSEHRWTETTEWGDDYLLSDVISNSFRRRTNVLFYLKYLFRTTLW